jgi:hypothetical protein
MRYWDGLVTGERSGQSREHDATPLEDTVRQVHAQYNAQAADPSFSAHLLDDLMRAHQHAEAAQTSALSPFPIRGTNGRKGPDALEWPGRGKQVGRREAIAAFAAIAALLIGALTGTYFWLDSDPEGAAVIPAFVAQSEEGEVASTTLLDITFPPGQMHAEADSKFILSDFFMAPGTRLDSRSECPLDDFSLYHVKAGILSINVVGESHILRVGETAWETVSGGTEAHIGTGDTWLYHNHYNGDDYEGVSNQSQEDVQVLWVVWGNNTECIPPVEPRGMMLNWYHTIIDDGVDTSQPTRLVLRSLVGMPGATFQTEGPAGLTGFSNEQEKLGMRQWVHVESGTLELGFIPVLPDDDDPGGSIEYRTGATVQSELVYGSPDRRVVFMNAADEPLEVTVLDVIVGDEATGGTPSPQAAMPLAPEASSRPA